MHDERDPRVVEIAEKLAMAQPYGFEYVKSGPSAADYHAALIAVKTLDEQAEYEYAILRTRVGMAGNYANIVGENWGPREEVNEGLLALTTEKFEYKVVKRRKAGEAEDV